MFREGRIYGLVVQPMSFFLLTQCFDYERNPSDVMALGVYEAPHAERPLLDQETDLLSHSKRTIGVYSSGFVRSSRSAPL